MARKTTPRETLADAVTAATNDAVDAVRGPAQRAMDAADAVTAATNDAVDAVRGPAQRAMDVLNTIAHDGLVDVVVIIAHDGLFVDDQVSLPVCERTAGLLEIGYVDIAIPESP